MALTDVPRVPLGIFPTPLQRVESLSGGTDLRDLLLKRDDLTGFAWGGNKVRALEYVLADALALGADTIVVAGGPTSNFAALLAIAASGHGLAVTQVCYGEPRDGAGALAVSRRAGAVVEFTGSHDRDSMDERASAIAECHRAEGGRAYVVPRGGATAVGACGFAGAATELVTQLAERGVLSATVVLPVGSGGSIAGLLAGLGAAGTDDRVDVVGVSVSRPVPEIQAQVAVRATACASLVGASGPLPRWRLVDGRGSGYGARSKETDHLASRVLRHGGLVADPVYNAKALLWLAQHRSELRRPVVYWSTGGALASADDLITTTTADARLVGKEARS
jgi:1-aminocyclopropane-1-carboxylate deaminase/D-cysteine desulfhydrase-like pyridoxal-dependent ACC family enzyme